MALFKQLVTLLRGKSYEAGTAVADANALTILDQQIRDANNAQAKARDDLATLTAKRRLLEKDVEALAAQREKYEASARAAMARGDMDLAREVAERLAKIEADGTAKVGQVTEMRSAEERMRQIIAGTDSKVETLRREVEIVRANESVQRAQASVAASAGGATNQLGSAADSLKRLKERQAIRDERFRAAEELELQRTGGDLDEKLRSAGLLPGTSSADDILARLGGPSSAGALTDGRKDPLALPRE